MKPLDFEFGPVTNAEMEMLRAYTVEEFLRSIGHPAAEQSAAHHIDIISSDIKLTAGFNDYLIQVLANAVKYPGLVTWFESLAAPITLVDSKIAKLKKTS